MSWRRLYSPQRVSVALLALLASATSLVNGFVYDDGPIIQTNARVHTLARFWEIFAQPYWPPGWGDANYRPLTILSFAIQWAVGGGSPAVFHAANVVLYVATSLAVLALARLVLPPNVAWLVAALFAVHPVHVEAVGNVVGQAELVVSLCSALAVVAYLRLRRAGTGEPRGEGRTAGAIASLYVVALLSKETGFFLPGLLLAAEATVVGSWLPQARRATLTRVRETWRIGAACAAIAAAYVFTRVAVLGGTGDDPNAVVALLGHKARLLTMLGVVPEWARLLVWPARLAADYSPPAIRIFAGFSWALVPAAAILALGVLVCIADSRRRVATFGIAWLAVALFPVSNLYLRSGVILAERTLLLPSIGFLFALGAAATLVAGRYRARIRLSSPSIGLPAALLLLLGVVWSARRQHVWRSNDDFFRRIVEDAPLGYRAHYMHGMWLFEQGRRAEGERHVRTAIALFPYDAEPYTDLAHEYRKTGLCAAARPLYRRALAVGSLRPGPRLGLVACLLQDGEYAEARAEARRGVERGGPAVPQFTRLLALADSVAGPDVAPVTLSGTPRAEPDGTGSRP